MRAFFGQIVEVRLVCQRAMFEELWLAGWSTVADKRINYDWPMKACDLACKKMNVMFLMKSCHWLGKNYTWLWRAMIGQIQVRNYDRRSIVNDNRMQISGLPNNKWKAVISQAKNYDWVGRRAMIDLLQLWLTGERAVIDGYVNGDWPMTMSMD